MFSHRCYNSQLGCPYTHQRVGGPKVSAPDRDQTSEEVGLDTAQKFRRDMDLRIMDNPPKMYAWTLYLAADQFIDMPSRKNRKTGFREPVWLVFL